MNSLPVNTFTSAQRSSSHGRTVVQPRDVANDRDCGDGWLRRDAARRGAFADRSRHHWRHAARGACGGAVFIGSSNVSAAHGRRDGAKGSEMQPIFSKAIAVANAANQALSILSTDGGAAKYFEQGVTPATVATDIHLFVRACIDLSAKFEPWREKKV